MLNTEPEQLSQNDDYHDGYTGMIYAPKHKQRENELVKHIGDKCNKNLRTSEEKKKKTNVSAKVPRRETGSISTCQDAICPS